MTRHTRNRQMVEINRRNPRKKLMLRVEMSSINVTMESVYREPKVWDLDPNFHAVRVTALKVTHRKGTHHPKNNHRLINKHKRLKNKEVYEQLNEGLKYAVDVIYHEDNTPFKHAMTYKTITKTIYFYTFKQPHYTGNGRYFNRILGRTKYGEPHYDPSYELPREQVGLFDEDGYRLVVDHGDGTHSKTY
ncbi:hypothetical protein BCPG3_070 [Bacillus phage BCPG3]|uniref:Uncharacterized protein n=1 Tax=Bacillus phage SalinJah TaxID=1837830 RepID=A0A173GBZ1_9CAUD|nr:hypothetical protein SALINJAH_10 [Bacillus phage SalinJah]ANH50658.1 hypothetical protein SALINJAH_10 [Bacillus phage SalinJah]QQO38931.1 hypothetical protein BCPG1_200 [Bacillus phage BCPG1]QSJ04387.1 hypothetical protein BCPG3_070 [Bacillus phage BCPG3]QSJ04601.1 hypothetical protein BCP18_069 [Bacillus phage BCP18]